MSKHEKQDKQLFYKRMVLKSTNLVVEVKEKSKWDIGEITIYHSPAKWDGDKFMVHLKDRRDLQDYIVMLQDFDESYGDLLDLVKSSPRQQKEVDNAT